MTRSAVTVLGSANADLVLAVHSLPGPGETVLAGDRRSGPGGKGLNQAVAAARAGAATAFVGAVGDDAEGELVRSVLAAEGITAVVATTAAPTGLAVVAVDERGENSIIVSPGANAGLTDLSGEARDAIGRSAVLVLQCEVPLAAVSAGVAAARETGTLVVLNAAPVVPLPAEVLAGVDVLVVNEGEARSLAAGFGTAAADLDDAVTRLTTMARAVVVTLGARGALHRDQAGANHRVPAPKVDVVDTTAAGDTFTGYLAAALAGGASVPEALQLACTAGALCVGRPGAADSVPTVVEVHRRLAVPG